jgi:hypothetical protein
MSKPQPQYYHYVNHDVRKTWTQLYPNAAAEQITMDEQARLRYEEGYRFTYYAAEKPNDTARA